MARKSSRHTTIRPRPAPIHSHLRADFDLEGGVPGVEMLSVGRAPGGGVPPDFALPPGDCAGIGGPTSVSTPSALAAPAEGADTALRNAADSSSTGVVRSARSLA